MEVGLMKNKPGLFAVLIVLAALFLFFSPALASDEDYSLVFRREFGVGMPGAVQGHMSMTIKGNLDAVEKVVYIIDGQEMASMTAPSLKFQFNTDEYPAGKHTFYALVTTKTGETKQTAPISVSFIAADEAGALTRKIFIAIGAILLMAALVSVLLTKRQLEASKAESVSADGLWGAAICPKCGRAFTRTVIGLNLISNRYEPCPHCRKWSMTQRATKDEIEQAERKLKATIAETLPETTLAKIRGVDLDQIEESKYTEL
jgi:hypothetical protein